MNIPSLHKLAFTVEVGADDDEEDVTLVTLADDLRQMIFRFLSNSTYASLCQSMSNFATAVSVNRQYRAQPGGIDAFPWEIPCGMLGLRERVRTRYNPQGDSWRQCLFGMCSELDDLRRLYEDFYGEDQESTGLAWYERFFRVLNGAGIQQGTAFKHRCLDCMEEILKLKSPFIRAMIKQQREYDLPDGWIKKSFYWYEGNDQNLRSLVYDYVMHGRDRVRHQNEGGTRPWWCGGGKSSARLARAADVSIT